MVAREFIEEGESAKTTARTQLQALLTYCRTNKGKVDVVVIYNVSRLSRDRFDYGALRMFFKQTGITVRSATEPVDDTSTGKMVEGLMSVFAQFDNDQKAERTAKGMQAALALGRWTFQAPLGYVSGNPRTGSSLALDPVRAPLVRLAFDSVDNGKPVPEALRLVIAAGLRTKAGMPISSQSFWALLRNPIYAGRVVVAKWGVDRDGDFEPIVAASVFRRVSARLAGKVPEAVHRKRDRDDFPLRRFLVCARCRRAVSGSLSRGRSRRYAYYHCPKCPGVRGRSTDVENLFRERLDGVQMAPGYMRLFREIVLDVWRTEQAQAVSTAAVMSAKVSAVQGRLERLDEVFIYQQAIDRSTYEKQRDKLREELTLAELAAHEAKIEQFDVEGVLGFAEHLVTNAGRLWAEGTLEQRQLIQRAIFPEGLTFDGTEVGTGATCLAFMQLPASGRLENGMASPPGFESQLVCAI